MEDRHSDVGTCHRGPIASLRSAFDRPVSENPESLGGEVLASRKLAGQFSVAGL